MYHKKCQKHENMYFSTNKQKKHEKMQIFIATNIQSHTTYNHKTNTSSGSFFDENKLANHFCKIVLEKICGQLFRGF